MAECGDDLSPWPSPKHFTSSLGLAPSNTYRTVQVCGPAQLPMPADAEQAIKCAPTHLR
ncbi:hypothetical protein HAP48_0004825 [Bradyrhizobium septentrionale]|uniref:hypothetical protein n=1 Tax=Bradyrhizobium septentrionale TaxID=1404411 RepID=UPI001CCF36EC|nr:hypothetical protein [Bradyrhizobium septentrionale]UGY20424.1 hypothetical protein HAP48_0004825 [Bradyrhizobium septentrionale]